MPRDYEPSWPETVVLWGAGATASLGFPTTPAQAKTLTRLAAAAELLDVRVRSRFAGADRGAVCDLLSILGDGDTASEREAALGRRFPTLEKRAREARGEALRRLYDWPSLRRVIRVCPRDPDADDDTISLQALFDLLDLHIQSASGFHAPATGDEPPFLRPDDLIGARRALQLLTAVQFAIGYRNLLAGPAGLGPYQRFADALAELIRDEGTMMAGRGHPPQDRRFNLFGYAVVSLNWDPLLLWLVFDAHRRANQKWSVLRAGAPERPLKLFNDLGYLVSIRKVESRDLAVWYAMNESAVNRLNDPGHAGDRYIRFGKYLLPHGSFAFRECPSCGKLNAWLGDEWEATSPTLLPPLPLPCWSSAGDRPCARTTDEQKAWERGEYDVLTCAHCGARTTFEHVRLAMQTSFKTPPPPFLEEMQREVRILVENARHIVLLGYSLPRDDVIYRSILAARLARRHDDPARQLTVTLVNYHDGAPDRWLEAADMAALPAGNPLRQVYEQFRAIVGATDRTVRFRGYGRGVPDAFAVGQGGAIGKETVRDLLFPDGLWTDRRPAGVP